MKTLEPLNSQSIYLRQYKMPSLEIPKEIHLQSRLAAEKADIFRLLELLGEITAVQQRAWMAI
jgi:hypothetical protein